MVEENKDNDENSNNTDKTKVLKNKPSNAEETSEENTTPDKMKTDNIEQHLSDKEDNNRAMSGGEHPTGSVFAVPKLPAVKFEKLDFKSTNNKVEKTKELTSKQSSKLPKDKNKEFPSKEPSWGGLPDHTNSTPYSLTVLKDGIQKESIPLSGKSRYTFGRLDDCDVVTEHPSCSRHHAVLQYCVEERDVRMKGFYLYDMGSTHGTYVNKQKVKPNVYNRVRVGYQLKFGGSSRLYIVEGPEDDQEQEADVDAMREKRRLYEQRKVEKKSLKKKQIGQVDATEESKEEDTNGHEVTWGFGEDAQEEGINLKELFERKQEFEVKDPKKTLNGFFEREGLEFEYEMSEKGSGKSAVHIAKVRLPLDTDDGEEIFAEGSGSNKKDAVLSCATEACRLIQAYDCMQNRTREDQRLIKQRELEANDFYDSDEDSFLDRTGNIEKKRMQRKKRAGKQDQEKVETHDSLKKKLEEKEKELSMNEKKLNRSKAAKELEGNGDSLDAYMSSMKDRLDKTTETKLKRNILELKKEINDLNKLVEKTKPALPALKVNETTFKVPEISNVMSAKITRMKHNEKCVPKEAPQITHQKKEAVVEEDCQVSEKKMADDQNDDKTEIKPTPPPKKKAKLYGAPAKPTTFDADNEFVGWTPPENQTGDGRTHLNDKLGY